MMLTKKILAFFLLFAFAYATRAQQSFTGTWKTIDDETKQAKSHVEIYQTGNKYHGKVAKLLLKPADTKCEKCTGDRHNKNVVGMVMLENMVLDGRELQDGKILDPENGKWYSCKMWLKDGDPNTLVVRGYLFGFYRTQYWYRVK
jgi:uncharacterized protein (DUF2147 family)